MTGFWVLVRKEILEQRRTRKFLALAGVFTALALLTTVIPFIVLEVKGEPHGSEQAREMFAAFAFAVLGLGTLLAIIVSMGSLAGERASGTAAMTLSKPVTRSAFVGAKFLVLVASILLALALASAAKYVLTLVLFGYWDVARFTAFMAIVGVHLVFVGSIAFFFSGMLARPLVAGGLALFLFIAQQPLNAIPHTSAYLPFNVAPWGADVTGIDDEAEGGWDKWPALPIALGSVALLSVGAWGAFRKKEL